MNPERMPSEYREILERIARIESLMSLEKLPSGEHNTDKAEFDERDDLSIPRQAQVVIKSEAYLNMAAHAIKFAHPKRDQSQWVEVIGLLTGLVADENTPLERIVVNQYWPVGHGNAVSVNILEAEPVMDILQKKEKEEFIVGWAHSHPSYSPYLSIDDVRTQARYQALWESSIAIVIDPTMISKESYGFEAFRLSGRHEYYRLDTMVEGMTPEAAFAAISLFMNQLEE